MKKSNKNWIQDAIKHKGALRKTALKKGLLRNEDEKLSMTDLKKLEKMGGKTAQRSRLAKTLRKFDVGGSIQEQYDIKKYIIEDLRNYQGGKFYVTDELITFVEAIRIRYQAKQEIIEALENYQGGDFYVTNNLITFIQNKYYGEQGVPIEQEKPKSTQQQGLDFIKAHPEVLLLEKGGSINTFNYSIGGL